MVSWHTQNMLKDNPIFDEPTKTIILRARVEVEVSAIDPTAVVTAIAELRRTLECEGYSPAIDYRGETNG